MTTISELESIYEKLEQLSYDVKRIHDKLVREDIDINTTMVLDLVTNNPGCTGNELGNMLGDTKDRVRKTLYSLRRQKRIIDSGTKICDITNHEASCWFVK